jgi:hypothetical protein
MPTRRSRITALGATAAVVAAGLAQPQPAKAGETTVSVDNARTGWDRDEPGLSPADVSDPSFGQIFSTTVDGQVFAQPLVQVSAAVNGRAQRPDPLREQPAWWSTLALPIAPSSTAVAVRAGRRVFEIVAVRVVAVVPHGNRTFSPSRGTTAVHRSRSVMRSRRKSAATGSPCTT